MARDKNVTPGAQQEIYLLQTPSLTFYESDMSAFPPRISCYSFVNDLNTPLLPGNKIFTKSLNVLIKRIGEIYV
jgi:hypothetical protein